MDGLYMIHLYVCVLMLLYMCVWLTVHLVLCMCIYTCG